MTKFCGTKSFSLQVNLPVACDAVVTLPRRSSRGNPVILIVDAEIGVASQANRAVAAIRDGKPEITHPAIDLFDLCVLCPEGRVPGGLSFNTYDCEVLPINPDLATVEKFVFHARLNRKYVKRATRRLLAPQHCELVIILIERYTTLILNSERFLFTLQQLLENSLDDQLGAQLRTYGKFLCSGRLIFHIHDHFRAPISRKAAVFQPIDPGSLVSPQFLGALQISPDQVGDHLFDGQPVVRWGRRTVRR